MHLNLDSLSSSHLNCASLSQIPAPDKRSAAKSTNSASCRSAYCRGTTFSPDCRGVRPGFAQPSWDKKTRNSDSSRPPKIFHQSVAMPSAMWTAGKVTQSRTTGHPRSNDTGIDIAHQNTQILKVAASSAARLGAPLNQSARNRIAVIFTSQPLILPITRINQQAHPPPGRFVPDSLEKRMVRRIIVALPLPDDLLYSMSSLIRSTGSVK